LPVSRLTLELLTGEEVPVPFGEILIPNWERRQRRRQTLGERSVEQVDLAEEDVERPAVPDAWCGIQKNTCSSFARR